MTYEKLQLQNNEVPVKEMNLSEVSGLKGLYYNGNIAIEKNLTSAEKTCVLAEELGHHYTTTGNILDQQEVANIKQELHARTWAYNVSVLSVSSKPLKPAVNHFMKWLIIWK